MTKKDKPKKDEPKKEESEEIEDIFGSKNNYQVTSAYSGTEDSIYNIIVKEKKMFPSMYHFFALGLVYGILHNKKSEKTRGGDIIRIDNISDEKTRDVINICYMSLNDGRNQTEIVSEMMSFADGGIEALYEIYEKNGSFQIPMLIEDSKDIWAKRVKQLHNINIEDL